MVVVGGDVVWNGVKLNSRRQCSLPLVFCFQESYRKQVCIYIILHRKNSVSCCFHTNLISQRIMLSHDLSVAEKQNRFLERQAAPSKLRLPLNLTHECVPPLYFLPMFCTGLKGC
jgi:hypothetical protein